MTQEMIRARNMQSAKNKFLRRHKKQKIYDATRTFSSWKNTRPNDRVYRITGVHKNFYNKRIHRKRK